MKAGGIDSAQARERASSLGVDDKSFNTAVARIEGVDMTPTPTVAGPAAPLTGRALAEKNIATMGQAGATADYFKRKDTEMLAKQSKQIDMATATPPTYRSGEARSASASVTPSFSSMFSREVDNDMAPMPSIPTASTRPSARSEGGEDFGTFRPRPAPTSLFGAVREDAAANRQAILEGAAAGREAILSGAAEGRETILEGAAKGGQLLKRGAGRLITGTGRVAKNTVPGRTGEYLRNR